jgi:hypothetical protein
MKRMTELAEKKKKRGEEETDDEKEKKQEHEIMQLTRLSPSATHRELVTVVATCNVCGTPAAIGGE